MGECLTDEEINDVYDQTDIRNVLAYTMPYSECNITLNWEWIEYPHGNLHGFTGGDMLTARTSANDPCFYFLHSFIDLIFEGWRLKRQNRYQRENDYPPDIAACEASAHFKYSTMAQFYPLRNCDGLRNDYTDNMYEYAPRPTCSINNPDCGSKWLFCDLSHGNPHCAAKACLGGNCSGFINGEDVCFESICLNNVCVETTKHTDKTTTTSSFCSLNSTNNCQCLCTF